MPGGAHQVSTAALALAVAPYEPAYSPIVLAGLGRAACFCWSVAGPRKAGSIAVPWLSAPTTTAKRSSDRLPVADRVDRDGSLAPEILEARRRQLGVSDRVLN
jgi:hypothetical protein